MSFLIIWYYYVHESNDGVMETGICKSEIVLQKDVFLQKYLNDNSGKITPEELGNLFPLWKDTDIKVIKKPHQVTIIPR